MLMTTEHLHSAALSIAGRKRPINEDAVYQYTDRTTAGEDVGLYIVCDGLGGHEDGDVASRLAVETVVTELRPLLHSGLPVPAGSHTSAALIRERAIQVAVGKANDAIRQRSRVGLRAEGKMATTIVLALIMAGTVHVAHVGDSRAYFLQGEHLIQMTRDHSLVAELATNGHISPSEIVGHPRNNVLLRTVGHSDRVETDQLEWRLHPGDRMLLCSDGLWKAFPSSSELASWLGAAAPPSEICARLVVEANRRDGSDNISAVVVSSAESGEKQEQRSRRELITTIELEPVPSPVR